MSSADNLDADESAADLLCCSSCGVAEIDDIKLKPCDGCDLVRYCSDECKEDYRREHETSCKERAAELRDEILFRQPESTHLGDCPICFLPLPLEAWAGKRSLLPCCSTWICDGCLYAENARQHRQNVQDKKCPFCRHSLTNTNEEELLMKRVEANDPNALRQMGQKHFQREEFFAAFRYWIKAAKLGDAVAHHKLALLYSEGEGVENDEKKIFHFEEAAIAGHPLARHDLGIHESRGERFERAVKHWIIAANLGNDKSLQELKNCYKDGLITNDDLAAAIRAHHAALAARKSPQRREAEELFRDVK